MKRRRLGAELRRLRERAGLTGEQVIAQVGWASASKLSRLENGRSRPDLGDILDLLDLYGVEQPERDELVRVARDAGDVRKWLRSYPVMTQRQRRYAELEAGCAEIREYAPLLVPGLLQTPDYARVRITSWRGLLPPEGRDAELPEAEVEVAARMARQSLLVRPVEPPQYAAVIEETAIGVRAGPAEVVRGQLARLADLAALPNVTVQVLRQDAVVADWCLPHTGFSLYRFADPQDPETLALEGLTTDVMLTDHIEVERYATVFQRLQEAAMSAEETVAWLRSGAAGENSDPWPGGAPHVAADRSPPPTVEPTVPLMSRRNDESIHESDQRGVA